MLGGMSGGGMAMFVEPSRAAEFRGQILAIMGDAKRGLGDALPFAMDPVVYDFQHQPGRLAVEAADRRRCADAGRYYALQIPELVRRPAEPSHTCAAPRWTISAHAARGPAKRTACCART